MLRGQAGFDTLEGGAGNDTLVDGGNTDLFVFANGFGADAINDLAATDNAERIDLGAVSAIVKFTDLLSNHMSWVGVDVVIDAEGGNTITLLNTNFGDLDAADFVSLGESCRIVPVC